VIARVPSTVAFRDLSLDLLILGPSVVAAILLLFAIERAWTKKGVPPTPLRLFASYLLLLPAFGVGTCWGVLAMSGLRSKFSPQTVFAELCCGGVVALVTAGYAWRAIAVGRAHAARGGEGAELHREQGRRAALAMVVLCALGLAALYVLAGA
jgi:hypothetical protein